MKTRKESPPIRHREKGSKGKGRKMAKPTRLSSSSSTDASTESDSEEEITRKSRKRGGKGRETFKR
jgi:hypothetical protein